MKKTSAKSLFNIAQVELIYRNKAKAADRPVITSSKEAYNLLLSTWDKNRIELVETFKVMLLDRRNTCLGISEIATGGVHGCVVDPKIIFATALLARACNVILAHNHPSGGLVPGNGTITLSRRIREGGKYLDIRVLDHLIVTPDQFYSFADNGMYIPG